MRIVHLTSVHPWHDSRIFYKMCVSLAASGYDTHLVVPRGDGEIPEQVDGVTIHPVPIPRGRLHRWLKTVKEVFAAGAALDGDIYHFHDPEGIHAAVKWQVKLQRPFIHDVHEDDAAAIMQKDWLPGYSRKLIAKCTRHAERRSAQKMAGMICATPAIADLFPEATRKTVIRNYAIPRALSAAAPAAHHGASFAYVGQISMDRGLTEMLAASALTQNCVKIRIAGGFSPTALVDRIRDCRGHENMTYEGYLDRNGIADLLASCVAGLVLLHPVPAFRDSLPIKMFEYMESGMPVIASNFPCWREIVEDNRCGLLVDPKNPREIAQAMDYLLEHPREAEEMGRRGRKAVEEKYSWHREFERLRLFYDAVVADWRKKS